jgi:two-component system CheB/CheR fusion protein
MINGAENRARPPTARGSPARSACRAGSAIVSIAADIFRPAPAPRDKGAGRTQTPPGGIVFVVDDDFFAREMICDALRGGGRTVTAFDACEAFLAADRPAGEACLVLDMHFAGMGGVELMRRLATEGPLLPTVVVSGSSDIPVVVAAMQAGAVDFLEKPLRREPLISSVAHALDLSRAAHRLAGRHDVALDHLAGLTPRQREIMGLILAGLPNKNIAADLGISRRTVETHRAAIMRKTGARSLPALARLAVTAAWTDPDHA